MEVAIGMVLTNVIMEQAPVTSIQLKMALATLSTSLVGLVFQCLRNKHEKSAHDRSCLRRVWTRFCCCGCSKQKQTNQIDVCDWFAAEAIARFVDTHRDNQMQMLVDNLSLEWRYGKVSMHQDKPCKVPFHTVNVPNCEITVTKLTHYDEENNNNRRNHNNNHDQEGTQERQEERAPCDAYLRLSTSAPLSSLKLFIEHTQQLMPFRLYVHRHGFSMHNAQKHKSSKEKRHRNDDEEDGEDGGGGDNVGLSSIFFSALERYFLQLRQASLHSAYVGFMGNDTVLGAAPFTFPSSLLHDEFEGHTISIMFVFPRPREASWTAAQSSIEGNHRVNSLAIECNTLRLEDLKRYLNHVFDEIATRETASLLHKVLKVYEVQLQGSEKHVHAEWRSSCVKTNKSFRNTIVSEMVERDFIYDLREFADAKDHYMRCGQPWKRGYVLCGPPGTGKSSLIKAAAFEFGFPVFTIDLSMVTCELFVNLITEMNYITRDKPHILALEDIDRCGILFQRRNRRRLPKWGEGDESSSDEENEEARDEADQEGAQLNPKRKKIPMAVLLNALDGIKEPFGRITIFTGNNCKKFQKSGKGRVVSKLGALFRTGRIDKLVYVGFADLSQIKRAFLLHFPEADALDESKMRAFEDLKPALLCTALMRAKNQDEARAMLYGEQEFPEHGYGKPRELLPESAEDKKRDDIISARRVTRKKPKEEEGTQNKKPPRMPTAPQARKKLNKLQKTLKDINGIMLHGDKAALDWHEMCKTWRDRFAAQEEIYAQIASQFKTTALPTKEEEAKKAKKQNKKPTTTQKTSPEELCVVDSVRAIKEIPSDLCQSYETPSGRLEYDKKQLKECVPEETTSVNSHTSVSELVDCLLQE